MDFSDIVNLNSHITKEIELGPITFNKDIQLNSNFTKEIDFNIDLNLEETEF